MYHEPLVHPIMQLHPNPQRVLVLGGGDGCAVRELLKYPSIERIDLVDLDPKMTNLGTDHPVLMDINQGSMHSDKLKIYNKDAYIHLEQNTADFYDVIIADLPDPRNIELGRLYSHEFYTICHRKLRKNGLIITQAGSPYFATDAYNCIDITMQSAGFTTTKLHNQIISMGEWGWILGTKNPNISAAKLTEKLRAIKFENIKTNWINQEAMQLITSFGKDFYKSNDSVQVNKVHNPVLYKYYLKGNWDIY
jgi:spermidine synthase